MKCIAVIYYFMVHIYRGSNAIIEIPWKAIIVPDQECQMLLRVGTIEVSAMFQYTFIPIVKLIIL